MKIELTEDERDALWALCFCLVGGDPKGPRTLIDSIKDKIEESGEVNRRRFSAEIEGGNMIVLHERYDTWQSKVKSSKE